MTYFFRQQQMAKGWGKEINAAWDEADHPRGKTTPESNSGSFAPRGGGGGGKEEDATTRNWRGVQETASAIRSAFADAQPSHRRKEGGTEAGYEQRQLHFIAPQPLTAELLAEMLPDLIGGYNRFDPKKVGVKIEEVARNAKVWVGRQGSPALFITGTDDELKAIAKIARRSLKADEVDIHEAGYSVKDYSKELDRPDKNTRFDPEGFEKLKTFDTKVLRLWWD